MSGWACLTLEGAVTQEVESLSLVSLSELAILLRVAVRSFVAHNFCFVSSLQLSKIPLFSPKMPLAPLVDPWQPMDLAQEAEVTLLFL